MRINDHNYHTFDERYETLLSWKDKLSNYISRGVERKKGDNVITIRTRDNKREWNYTHNIVTDAGDLFYAQQAAGETPTNDFDGANGRYELNNPASADTIAKTDQYQHMLTPLTASRSAFDGSYPQTNDGDANNTGAGTDIVSWSASWTTTDFDTGGANDITGGCIHVGGASPISTTALLSHWNYSSAFEKLDSDTLQTFVNHEFLGV